MSLSAHLKTSQEEHHASYVTVQEVGRRIPYAFLEDIRDRFVRSHGEAAGQAPAYGLDEQFGHVIADRMRFFSTDRSADAISRVRGELGEVRDIMIQNIDKVEISFLSCLVIARRRHTHVHTHCEPLSAAGIVHTNGPKARLGTIGDVDA